MIGAARLALSLGLLAILAAPATAQPDMARPAPENIADRGSALYRFEEVRLDSADGARHYRLRVAIPRRAPPAQGYPVAWLLDGKAALPHIDETLLAELDAAGPPVIVAVGHDTPLRLDGPERRYDYTPRIGSSDPRGRPGGGADAFLDLIEDRMMPKVAAAAHIDRRRQLIWGHSLGGLFVLHAFMTRPKLFSGYYAASPSLWWDEAAIVRRAAEPAAGRPCACGVVLAGGKIDDDRIRARRGFAAAMPDGAAVAGFLAHLGQRTSVVPRQVELPGMGHGETLGATVAPALRMAAGIVDDA
ncbi:MAG: alpha/beta hydrolase [Sphingopyxis macrogoltabida]|uniref:Alpha/beta hydrolase n=1 Tax=Sphingopyxis macrogoltabida TaxID=33050 RepID=A0A2W5MTE8_SPHMC|nr:MAG: alpha/beta hydrolase [Sphingopyxis macrogoltabida]